MDFIIRIAEKNIKIHSIYSGIYKKSKDYLVDDIVKPDVEIFITEDMIDQEVERIRQSESMSPGLQTIEGFIIHRLIADSFLDYKILLMHGAVISVDNASFMFSGRSGTGKTTHVQKWQENVTNSEIINGDKPFIIINQDNVLACGNPWCGKEGFGTNKIVPLHGIVFMERSDENHIEKVSFKSVLFSLLEQTYQPSDPKKLQKTIELLYKMKDCVSFYRFSFDNFKEDAFRVSYNMLLNKL